VVQANKLLGFLRRLLRWEDFTSQFPPPAIDGESQARGVRTALEKLIARDAKRFDMLFLQGKACAAQPAEWKYLDVLAKAGYVKKIIGTAFRPCVRVFVLDNHFIATDLLSRTREDQVFSLMMEQVLLVRAMDVRKGDHFLELCLGSGVNTLSAASKGAGRAVGVDISARALAFAKANALVNLRPERDKAKLETFQGNLFEPLDPQDQFDLILINPPFELVPPGERYFLHSHGGEDGLDVIRAFLPGLKSRLKPGGRFEMFTWAPGDEQNERVSGLVAAALPGYRVEVIQADSLPLEERIATFKDRPAYQEWKNRLMAQGITHVWGVHVRAVESSVSEIVRIEAKKLVAECFAIASWLRVIRPASLTFLEAATGTLNEIRKRCEARRCVRAGSKSIRCDGRPRSQ
jgi:SAM-dependent methyltransferase